MPAGRMVAVEAPSLVRTQLDMRKRIKGNNYFQGEGGDEQRSENASEKDKSPPPAAEKNR